jgi:hypothetical protein
MVLLHTIRSSKARRGELLPCPYVHVVFTLPSQLAALALQNKKIVYSLLLRAGAETLLDVVKVSLAEA